MLCAIAHGCSSDSGAREPPSAPSEKAAPVLRSDVNSVTRDAGAADAAAAWTQFSRRDDVPLCLFARYADWGQAQLVGDAKQQVSLKARRPLYFGEYVPGRADPECVRRVTLQCWADVEGTSITVHTRLSGEQQAAHPCANNCKPSTAACETPPLKAGVYTITHGAQQRTIRIPGAVQPACLQEDTGADAALGH